jgi:hypothetical protein
MSISYNASNLPLPVTGQTLIFDAILNKFHAAGLLGGEFSYVINNTQFELGARNSFKSIVSVDSSSNPITMVPGYCYITTDNSSPVNFTLPAAGGSLTHGTLIKVAGFGDAGFTVGATGPQFLSFGGHTYNVYTSTIPFNQVTFCYDKFSSNNFWSLLGLQGSFVLT